MKSKKWNWTTNIFALRIVILKNYTHDAFSKSNLKLLPESKDARSCVCRSG